MCANIDLHSVLPLPKQTPSLSINRKTHDEFRITSVYFCSIFEKFDFKLYIFSYIESSVIVQ